MDVQIFDLWLPIVVAAFACFFASSVMWMVLPHHKADIRPLPDEKAFTEAVSPLDLDPGLYMYPNCQEGESMSSDEFKARWEQGPWGTINVIAAKPNFPRNLAVNLFECAVVAALTAYLASMAMNVGANSTDVIRFTFASAFLGFVVGGWSGVADCQLKKVECEQHRRIAVDEVARTFEGIDSPRHCKGRCAR